MTLAQLRKLAERQYVLDGCRSLGRLQGAFTHLERLFGRDARAPEITAVRLDAYYAKRMAAGISRSTVNHELSALRRAGCCPALQWQSNGKHPHSHRPGGLAKFFSHAVLTG